MNPEGFVDCHCHLLPSIDDGSPNISESLRMVKILIALGFKQIYCTPHMIKGIYDNNPTYVKSKVDELQKYLHERNINVKLIAGMEYTIDEDLINNLSDPLLLARDIILIEVPFQLNSDLLLEFIYSIRKKGLMPLIAHPERNLFFQNNMNITDKLISMGSLFQGNIGSFSGLYGKKIKKLALFFLDNGLFFRLGTDAHCHSHLNLYVRKGLATLIGKVGYNNYFKYFKDF